MSLARSPGKIILSGEHAILAGCPALVMATTPKVTCTCHPTVSGPLTLRLPNRNPVRCSSEELIQRADALQKRHATGLPPACPEDVLLSAVARVAPGWTGEITFTTALPLGSGMGASAAFLLSLLKALHPELLDEELYTKALEMEHLQHGTSSGIDIWSSLHGGIWWIDHHQKTRLECSRPPDFCLVHTGTPSSTTGECVSRVTSRFPKHHAIWQNFKELTQQTRAAIEDQASDFWSELIRENHRLLCEIGVVPLAVQKDISRMESAGGSAKICGAGSVSGDSAGVVLVRGVDREVIPKHWSDIDAKICTVGTTL